jgi:hypothetical protein
LKKSSIILKHPKTYIPDKSINLIRCCL